MIPRHTTLGFDKIYVINLKRRLDRKTKLIKENPHLNFTFIEAIDGKELIQKELLEKNLLNTSFYDPSGMVTMGVFACALSHKKAWDQALADGVDNALFLEDDIYLIENLTSISGLTPFYQDIFNEVKEHDFDLLFLGKKTEEQRGMNVGKHLTIPRFNSNHNGAHAYVATKEMIQSLSSQYLPVKYAADVYLEQFYKSHKVFTLKDSIIRQHSDTLDPSSADSDTYYNDFREGGGSVGISFDEKGNIINKRIAQYIKHPKDILEQYTEIVLERPKFGIQKFNPNKGINKNFLSIAKLISHLCENLEENSKMVELNSHLGENTFFFGCSNVFSNIYTIDSYKGKDDFNLSNNLTWEDIKIGFHSNTYFFEDIISNINQQPELSSNLFLDNDLSFMYINNRNNEDITPLLKLYLPKIKHSGYIGGDNLNDKPQKAMEFTDGSWLIKKTTYEL